LLEPANVDAVRLHYRAARRADGELIPLTSGSTERVAQAVSHAAIVKTRRFSFLL
jgi:hypothetical protein